MDKQIYIIISQPGTLVARILKWFTRSEYNHVSLSLTGDLQAMYSFGRRHRYHPFWGGFVKESPYSGVFLRYPNSRIVVLAVDVSEETHRSLAKRMYAMLAEGRKYRYNYLGVCLIPFRIRRRKENCYYCSEFVKDMLLQYCIADHEVLSPIVQPAHFLQLPFTPVYQGTLRDYIASN